VRAPFDSEYALAGTEAALSRLECCTEFRKIVVVP
jgi:hypothetical protein